MQNILIFANPISGRGRGQALAERIGERLTRDGQRVQTIIEPPEEMQKENLSPGAAAAVVIGGDGTLRTVADRLVQLFGSAPPLIFVPMGTANLMGRQLDIPRLGDEATADWVARAILDGTPVRIDAGRANGRLFLLVAGVGFDGYVVHALARSRRGPIHPLSYLRPMAEALTSYSYPPLTVVADGKQVLFSIPALAFIGNSREYGTGFPVLPLADPSDGLLDLCVLPCASRMQLIAWFLAAISGDHIRGQGAIYLRAKRIEVTSPQAVPIEIDGDPGGFTPLSIDLLPQQLVFMVPREPTPHG